MCDVKHNENILIRSLSAFLFILKCFWKYFRPRSRSTHRANVEERKEHLQVWHKTSHFTFHFIGRETIFRGCLQSRTERFLRAWWILEFRAHCKILLYNVGRQLRVSDDSAREKDANSGKRWLKWRDTRNRKHFYFAI